jgi:hypothetical protein
MMLNAAKMTFRRVVYSYAALVGAGIVANTILLRYRRHLYELNADYVREPLHQIQMVLFRGTEALIVVGAVLLLWLKYRDRN